MCFVISYYYKCFIFLNFLYTDHKKTLTGPALCFNSGLLCIFVCKINSRKYVAYMYRRCMIDGVVFSCCKVEQATPRSLDNNVGNLLLLAAYLNIFLNPLIYILRYDVIRYSLINWIRRIAARFKNQQPPAAS